MFPLIFGRVGGYSLKIFDSLKSSLSDTYVSKFLDSYREVEALRSALIEKLYLEINDERNEKRRNGLINFKRDLFNKRGRAENALQVLAFSEKLEHEIKRFFQKRADHENLVKDFNSIFCSEELANVEILNQIANSFFFRNGLIFSSQTLLRELKKRPVTEASRSVVISLLKYLTRSITKTTPFSSFNSIFFLHKGIGNFTSDEVVRFSNIQLSNLFYHYVKNYLLSINSFKDTLSVRCNSTIWIEDEPEGIFHFFQNDSNNESFKKLRCSSALLTIRKILNTNDITYGELILKLQQLSGDDKSSVEKFMTILVKEGFLKIIFPVSCTDKNWISELNAFLRKSQLTKEFVKLETLLSTISNNIVFLENCFDAELRYSMIMNCHDLTIDFFNSHYPSSEFSKKVSAQELFYEDHFAHIKEDITQDVLLELLSEVKVAFSSFNNDISTKRLTMLNMVRSFEAENNLKMPILHFYERFYLSQHQDSSFLNEELKKAGIVVSAIIRRIEEFPALSSVDISDLTEKDVKVDFDSPFGVYLQAEDEGFQHVVINSFSAGYGANVSRFLNSLPEVYANELIAYNKGLLPDKFIVEVKDASIHNVGTYPKVTEALIDLCDNRSSNDSYEIVSLADVFVSINDFKHLILVDRHGRNLQILNFSLEGVNRRSAFYRFIDLFNDTDVSGLNYVLAGIEQFFESKLSQAKIVFVPRINFGKRLVLQRRKWLVLKTTFMNIVNRTKENGENFLNINSFMIEHGIPAEVFIRFAKRNLENLQDDRYKPQYFNFRIPVFTALFTDQLNKAGDIIEISEMFPTSDGVMKTGGKVKEYILNCN